MEAKTILVTGSTDGIGRKTAIDLAAMGHRPILHGRERNRCNGVAAEIQNHSGIREVPCFVADLRFLEQVSAMAAALRDRFERIDVLINNAGVYEAVRSVTPDGFETTFAVNHLAHFSLTLQLLDLIPSAGTGRIVTVSSMVHAGSIDLSDLQSEKAYSPYSAYALSKLCNVLFTYELAERLAPQGISANCLHPGVINTKLLRAAFSGGAPVSEGARNLIFAATAEEIAGVTGKYFYNRRETRTTDITYDPAVRKQLWKLSLEMTGLTDLA
jgi:retinol dehydrogenase 14